MKTSPTANHLKSLVEKLEEKERLLDAAREHFEAAKRKDAYYISNNKPAPTAGPARASLEAIESDIGKLRDEVSRAEEEAKQRLAIEDAPDAVRRARKAMLIHRAEAKSLSKRKDLVIQRINTLRQEITAVQAALNAEEAAARGAYASAVSGGDEQGVQAASAALAGTQDTRQQALQKSHLNNGLVEILELEVVQLDAQITAASDAEQQEYAAQFAAVETVISDEWNQAVDHLATLAGKVAAIKRAQGGALRLFDSIDVPRLGKNKAPLKVSEVRSIAASVDAESLLD
jgi:predicted RNA binding protein with dsRBD fold (UPF0201 family)